MTSSMSTMIDLVALCSVSFVVPQFCLHNSTKALLLKFFGGTSLPTGKKLIVFLIR